MYINKNTPYFFAAICLFILLKLGFAVAGSNHLLFLLKPTTKLVDLLTGSTSSLLADSGYYNQKLNIIIDKSCSGFNFLLLSFLIIVYSFVRFLKRDSYKILAIPAALIVAYLLTIFVNSSRIIASIVVHVQTKRIVLDNQNLLHEAVGIITNLTFLVLFYCLLEKILNSKQKYAEPAKP